MLTSPYEITDSCPRIYGIKNHKEEHKKEYLSTAVVLSEQIAKELQFSHF